MSEREIGMILEFINGHKEQHDRIEKKLDDLLGFKWKVSGIAAGVSGIIGLVSSVLK